jgi:hypothetical protein
MKGKGTKTFKDTYFPAPAAPATNPVADTVKTAMN